jgi:arabinose-5-phosphate isomerase
MSEKGLGMTAVAAPNGQLLGIYTDGDLRRTLDKPIDIHRVRVSDVMTLNGKTAPPEMLAAEALQMMDELKINGLLVVDKNDKLVGAFNMHDLLRAGVM